MKKYFFIAAIALLGAGCTDDVNSPVDVDGSNEYYYSEFLVDEDDAYMQVLNFLGEVQSETRISSKYSNYEVTPIFPSYTRTVKKDPSFYLFNFQENNGFAVISADKRDTATVYMYSREGNLDVDMLQNELFISEFIEASELYQRKKILNYNPEKYKLPTRPDIVIEYVRTADTLAYTAPMSDKLWGQGFPFNVSLDGTSYADFPMGCGPVALALVADIFQYPKSYSSYSFNWDLIDKMKSGSDLIINTAGASEVSKLIYATGVATNVVYKQSGSPVTDINLLNGIRKMNFACDDYVGFSDNYGSITGSLINKRPVIMTGIASKGHAWVIDGFLSVHNDVKAYDQYGNPVPNTMLEVFNSEEWIQYLHCNYGWDGMQNGDVLTYQKTQMEGYPSNAWYFTNVFRNTKGEIYGDLKAICNIRPK